MKYLYFDAFSGVSGDMILGALLDLGVDFTLFKEKIASLELPVEIQIEETKRSSLRAVKVDVKVNRKDSRNRTWKDVEAVIKNSSFSSNVKKYSLDIFNKLFIAEAHVHGHKFHETHLHEAGADDALVDIVGSCLLVEFLDIQEFYSSPLNVGSGWVKTSHGQLPVPPPAVAEILKNIPVYSEGPKVELVTPTGAAIVSTLTHKFKDFPELRYEKIG